MSLADLYRKEGQVEKFPKPKGIWVRTKTNRSLFCEYHNSFGHKTEDCYDLRDAVEQIIWEGRLARYIASQRSLRKKRASPLKDEERRNPQLQRNSDHIRDYDNQEEEPIMRTINVIVRGFAGGGVTKSARKRHLQEVLSLLATRMKKPLKRLPLLKLCFQASISRELFLDMMIL